MRKLRQFFLTTLVLLCSALTSWAESEPYSGSPSLSLTQINGDYATYGLTEEFDGYYVISSAEDLYCFADSVNGGKNSIKAVLTDDIVVNENVLNAEGTLNGTPTYSWTPIGTSSKPFKGTFDGKDHTISGLYISEPTIDDVGLIGYANVATIKNVRVIDSYIEGGKRVGGICGYCYDQNPDATTLITNCYNTGTVSGSFNVGGICGVCHNAKTAITKCHNTGMITCQKNSGSTSNVGGICGYNGNQTECSNTGTVSGTGSYVGGICGGNGTQTNCHNTALVSGSGTYVGGICGRYGNQTECSNTGTVKSTTTNAYAYIGGICGGNGNQTKCYNTGTLMSNHYYVGGICGDNGTQTNCYNTGSFVIMGTLYYVGGICGRDGTQTNCYNTGTVSGSSNAVGGICGAYGTQDNCYYLESCGSKNTLGVSVTAEEIEGGKITYLLNGSTSGDNNVWRQNLGDGDDTDAFPVLDNHRVVYATQPCESAFSNTPNAHKDHNVTNDIGYCPVCGKYVTAATLDNGVYQIGSAAQLYWFAQLVNEGETSAKAILTADITVNTTVLNNDGTLNGSPTYSWTPIGTESKKYEGTFDGGGHTISGLYFENTTNSNYPDGGNYVGLIGYAKGATIENVGVINSYLRGYQNIGGICGYSIDSTTITNCQNTGTVSGSNTDSYAGGICGYGSYTTGTFIINCYNTGKVY